MRGPDHRLRPILARVAEHSGGAIENVHAGPPGMSGVLRGVPNANSSGQKATVRTLGNRNNCSVWGKGAPYDVASTPQGTPKRQALTRMVNGLSAVNVGSADISSALGRRRRRPPLHCGSSRHRGPQRLRCAFPGASRDTARPGSGQIETVVRTTRSGWARWHRLSSRMPAPFRVWTGCSSSPPWAGHRSTTLPGRPNVRDVRTHQPAHLLVARHPSVPQGTGVP